MIVCCIDTNRAHVVPGAATAPLETLAESADEVCDACRARIPDAALAFEDEAGCVLRGAAAMAALERRCRFRYVETLAFLHERHLRQRHLLLTPAAPSPEALFGGDFAATPALSRSILCVGFSASFQDMSSRVSTCQPNCFIALASPPWPAHPSKKRGGPGGPPGRGSGTAPALNFRMSSTTYLRISASSPGFSGTWTHLT